MNEQFTTPDEGFFFHHTKTKETGKTIHRPPEVHSRYEVFYLIEGKVEYVVEGFHYFVSEGDLLIVDAGKTHKINISLETDYERIVIMFDRTILPKYFSENTRFFDAMTPEQYPARLIPKDILEKFRIREILESIIEINEEKKYRHPLFIAQSILFLVELNKVSETAGDGSLPQVASPIIKKTVEYIDKHLDDDLSLAKLSSEIYINKFYLEHLFREEMNLSVNKYVTMKRIHIASELMRGGLNAQEACERVGYKYYSTFFYNYKKTFGSAPSMTLKNPPTLVNPDFDETEKNQT